MRRPGLHARLVLHQWFQWLHENLILALLEPILHASARRMWWLGLSFLAGHALFGWIWSVWLPQPYENAGLRVAVSLLGIILMRDWVRQNPDAPRTQLVFNLLLWLELRKRQTSSSQKRAVNLDPTR